MIARVPRTHTGGRQNLPSQFTNFIEQPSYFVIQQMILPFFSALQFRLSANQLLVRPIDFGPLNFSLTSLLWAIASWWYCRPTTRPIR